MDRGGLKDTQQGNVFYLFQEVLQMHINYLTVMAVLLAGISILLLLNKSLRINYVNWLYLFSGAAALYLIETTTRNESIRNTLLLVVVLCLIPIMVDGFHSSKRDQDSDHSKHKNP